MALTCARCGIQNADGTRFCTNCGTALVPAPPPVAPMAPAAYAAQGVAGVPQPGPGYAPPPNPQGYQSPYYVPQPGQTMRPVHRTPWMIIIAGIVAVVIVLGGVGTVLAMTLGAKHSTQSGSFQSLSSPSPVTSPPAGQTPPPAGQTPPPATPTSQPPPSGGSAVTTAGESVVVPSGWQVVNKDSTSVTIQDPDGTGTITVAAGQQSPPATAQQLKGQIDKAVTQKFPDAAECPGTSVGTGALAGANGIFWELCFTLTSGSQKVPVGEPLFVGTNAAGNVLYLVVLQTTQDNLDAFIKLAAPILANGITWNMK